MKCYILSDSENWALHNGVVCRSIGCQLRAYIGVKGCLGPDNVVPSMHCQHYLLPYIMKLSCNIIIKLDRWSSEHKDQVVCIQSGNDLQPQSVFGALKLVYPQWNHDCTTIRWTLKHPFQWYINVLCCGEEWANRGQNGLQLWLRTNKTILGGRGTLSCVPLPPTVVLFGSQHKCLNILAPSYPYATKYVSTESYGWAESIYWKMTWMWLMQLPLYTVQNPISATIGKKRPKHMTWWHHCLVSYTTRLRILISIPWYCLYI